METLAQLKGNFKKLRLSRMYENIEDHNQAAIKNKMSYTDFLLLLTQEELDRRKHQKIERVIKKAKLGKCKSIVEFDFDFNPKINRRQIMDFCTCAFLQRHENIILVGPTGVGKTFIAKAIGLETCRRGLNTVFVRTIKMLDEINSGHADGTFYKKLNKYIKPQLLILDEWGLQPFTDKQLTILNEIISERSEEGSIIITSNRPLKSWDELFREPVISSALLDRLFNQTHKIKISGKSYRRGII